MKLLHKLLVTLIMCSLFIQVIPVNAQNPEISPRYNNVASTTSSMNINSEGVLTIVYSYAGYPSTTTKGVITTYVEKRVLGLFWTRVDIGTANDEWVDTINDYRYTGTRTFQLSSSGTYRVSINYKIYGSGGAADEIDYEHKDSF